MYPKIRIGKFNTKLIIPVFTGVTIPKIIAIPPIPLLKILWGIRKRLKAIAIIKEPIITPRNLIIFFRPSLKIHIISRLYMILKVLGKNSLFRKIRLIETI